MKKILLTQGQIALIDDQDLELINQYKWCAHFKPKKNGGIYTAVHSSKSKTILMHRLIMNAKEKTIVDHIDRNPLNNQRSNLRFANNISNAGNQGLRSNNTSGYKGVTWSKNKQVWRAQIGINRTIKNLGTYKTVELAAAAYDKAAQEYFGEFAGLNTVKERYVTQ